MANNNVVIYARFSSSMQREESITGQVRDCTAYAGRCGYNVLRVYADRAISGTTDNRPEFQRMIKDSDKGEFIAVIVWKLDRFSRDKYDAARYKHALKNNGVRVLSAMEPISDSAEGVIMESLLEGMAEYYSKDLAEKVKRGQKDSALKYKSISNCPVGYYSDENHHFRIDPNKAPAVKRMFEEFDLGIPARQIAIHLEESGITAKNGNRLQWSTLKYMLKNEKYIGTYDSCGVRCENAFEPIIDRDLFERCQKRMQKPSYNPRRATYLLSSKMWCGDCGHKMSGSTSNTKQYYMCHSATKYGTGCPNHLRHRAQPIEDAVVAVLSDCVMSDEFSSMLEEKALRIANTEPTGGALQDLRAEKAETEKKIRNIMAAIEQGVVTKTTKKTLEEYEGRLEVIEHRIEQGKVRSTHEAVTREQIRKVINRLRGNKDNAEYRQMLVDVFLERVYVYQDGTLIVNIRYIGVDGGVLEFKTSVFSDRDVLTKESTTILQSMRHALLAYGKAVYSITHE